MVEVATKAASQKFVLKQRLNQSSGATVKLRNDFAYIVCIIYTAVTAYFTPYGLCTIECAECKGSASRNRLVVLHKERWREAL